MVKVDNIRYLYDATSHLEVILCNNSNLSYPLHNHVSVFTIGIVLDGSMILSTNLTTQTYYPNHTFVIPPYVPHSITTNSTYSLLSLCIHKDLINCSSYNTDKMMFDITNFLVDALGLNHINTTLLSRLLYCLHTLRDVYSVSTTSTNDACIDRLKKQIELFPENKFSVDAMAHAALMSKYCFIRHFKQMVGLTPHQFQIQNRIRKAQRIINTADTIAEVASITGFCDQSHFIKQFEKVVGLTPTIYKLSSSVLTNPTPPVNKVLE